jgi:hypothetical protein
LVAAFHQLDAELNTADSLILVVFVQESREVQVRHDGEITAIANDLGGKNRSFCVLFDIATVRGAHEDFSHHIHHPFRIRADARVIAPEQNP